MPHIFISYVHEDRDLVDRLCFSLKASGLEIWLDRDKLEPGKRWQNTIRKAIAKGAFFIACFSDNYLARSSSYAHEELTLAIEELRRRPTDRAWFIPVLFAKDSVPDRSIGAGETLRHIQYVDLATDWNEGMARLLNSLGVPRANTPPAGDEFSVELLTEPVVLTRTDAGTLQVRICRDAIRGHLHTTQAKRDLCAATFATPERLAAAHRLDSEIHRFILGITKEPSLVVHLDDLPLRWASGGVLSVVQWKGSLWTPFFFRDIAPYGWNIALGSSAEGDDLNNPWSFLWREFLEETLVLAGEPQPGVPIDYKEFVDDHLKVEKETALGARHAEQHIKARRSQDGLLVQMQRDPFRGLDSRFSVLTDTGRTRTELYISQGSKTRLHRNVLISISPLELGIEVVRIVEYSLAPADSILDGEMRMHEGRQYLVRMPIALISHAYLFRNFRNLDLDRQQVAEIQPSIEAEPIPAEHFSLFPFDALRRRDIAKDLDPRASDWERQRSALWMRLFGDQFFDPRGCLRTAHSRALFTPATAKILSYYFAGLPLARLAEGALQSMVNDNSRRVWQAAAAALLEGSAAPPPSVQNRASEAATAREPDARQVEGQADQARGATAAPNSEDCRLPRAEDRQRGGETTLRRQPSEPTDRGIEA